MCSRILFKTHLEKTRIFFNLLSCCIYHVDMLSVLRPAMYALTLIAVAGASSWTCSTGRYYHITSLPHVSQLLLPHLFPHVFMWGLMFFMRRLHLARSCASSADNSLRQVVPDVIQPPPLWSSPPSFLRNLHPHHSLAYVFVFSSQYVPIPLQPTFLHLDISPTFVVPLILS